MKIKTTSCNKGREKKTSLQGPGVLPGSTGYREAPKGGAERCGRKEERQVKTTSQSYTMLPLYFKFALCSIFTLLKSTLLWNSEELAVGAFTFQCFQTFW